MKKSNLFRIIIIVLFCFKNISAQNWTWINGSSTVDIQPYYGTKGVPDPLNTPGGRHGSSSWTDLQGNLWLFGGITNSPLHNDLWKYDISINQWTWINGSNVTNQYGSYGVKGVPSVTNTPGARQDAITWIDKNGNLWLFGGTGYYTNNIGILEDLWKYNISTNEWTWVNGSQFSSGNINYGMLGVSSPTNSPAGRVSQMSFTDTTGNFWLFGGFYMGKYLNDLWKYNLTTNEWTWMKGDSATNQYSIYGVQHIPNNLNKPGGRCTATGWSDSNNNFWLFGGNGYSESANGNLNDLWKYNVATNEWTWMSGSKLSSQPGHYGQIGIASISNTPSNRSSCFSWIDKLNNRLWMFGGSEVNNSIFNDLWQYNITTNEWTWITGDSTSYKNGVYGNIGVSDPLNTPGSREAGVCWVDNSNNFWLYGGIGINDFGGYGQLSDLWKFANPIITGIKKTERENLLSIYPNPNNGVFKLKLNEVIENSEIKIINALGQELYSKSLNTEITIIDTKNLSEGIYTLLLMQNKEIPKSTKFIVKD